MRRSYLSAVLIAAAAGALATGIHWAQAYTGRLEMPRARNDYGQARYTLGGPSYPRHATDAAGYTLTIGRPARRIASLDWALDEFAYAVADPASVVAVSENAYAPAMSNVTAWVERFHPVVASNAESLLALQPDLVLTNSSGEAGYVDVLQGAGIPVFRIFTMFTSLDEVARTIDLAGYLTGRDGEAREARAQFEDAVARARSRKPAGAAPPRILGYSGRYSYGNRTLFDDAVKAVGGVNVAAEHGLAGYDSVGAEQILEWNPDWIVTTASSGNSDEARAALLRDPAIGMTAAARKGQILVLDKNVFFPMSPRTARLLDTLGDALYGRMSE
jgi:iron complex transport system substrate-binding protein